MIDTDYYEASGIEILQFPGGEWHAKVPTSILNHVHIFAKIRTWDDFGKFLAVSSAYEANNVSVHAFMPYLPGARQDRIQPGFPLTAEIYAAAMTPHVTSLTAVDAHSEAALDLYRERIHYTRALGFGFIPDLIDRKYDYILAADEGGVDRTTKIQELLGVQEIRFCKKIRDSATGKLSGFRVPRLNNGTTALIADDICDGGGTFLGIANELPDVNLDLYVTHGIFSKGLVPLHEKFGRIYTTNSWYNGTDARVRSINLLPHYVESLTP